MKKSLLYALMILMSVPALNSCKDDDDDVSATSEREFMTMFRLNENTGKGEYPNDPYACHVEDLNTIKLYWYGVEGCAGYELKMSIPAYVASGEPVDWEDPQKILWDTIVGPDVLELSIKNLEYANDYRFAIRTLSKKGEAYHSHWYGYGAGRRWAEYCGITTDERYPVPAILSQSEITKNSFRINIDPTYDEAEDATEGYTEHFNLTDDGTKYKIDVLRIVPSAANPNAAIPAGWDHHVLTPQELEAGYVIVTGLDENSVYNVNVEDSSNPVAQVDKYYNTLSVRTDGTPGEPILIEHSVNGATITRSAATITEEEKAAAAQWNACRLDDVINDFINDPTMAEGTIFELEGDKVYYFATNVSLSKGFTLRTRPSDLAAGKAKAKVYMNGIVPNGNAYASCNFMFGRQPLSGESPSIIIYVKSLIFEDLDFDAPKAVFFNGASNGTGNYFINMYSNGMGVTLQSFEMRRCSLQRMVRGYIRVQGSRIKTFENMIIEDNEFYNCGFYDNNGRGYAWFAGDGNSAKSNIYKNMVVRNNTFYDSPRTCMFTDNGKNLDWKPNIQYKITLENNTFINFSTRSSGRQIFDIRYIPTGSSITCKKNLFILTKKSNDTRPLFQQGADIRQINGEPGEIELHFADNYSTNTNLTGNSIFSGTAFEATGNALGKWSYWNTIDGNEFPEGLVTKVDDISPEELMHQPNPVHVTTNDAGDGTDVLDESLGYITMHSTSGIEGKSGDDNNLYYRNTDKVRNSAIYQKGIGASKWREGIR